MDYTADTLKTSKTYNIDPRDVLFCQLVANGADRGEAYYCIYDHGGRAGGRTLEQARTKANEFFKLNPGAKILVQRIKERRQINNQEARNQVAASEQERDLDIISDDDLNKFTNKSYIIAQLAKEAKNLAGKERANVLMQIADLQRMKSEETRQEQEQRRYYLPYISHCRTCRIMQVFREISEKAGI